jgi:YbbR domain-containing protein
VVKTAKKKKTVSLWIYKIVSVIAAVLIWVMVTITQNPLDNRTFMVSLEQRYLPEGLILEKSVNQVQVRVEGIAAVINELSIADITAYVDLAGLKDNKYVLTVMVEHPDKVQVLTCRPDSIEVELKETLTDMFPLTVEVLGEPAPSYMQLEAVVSPAEVKLSGAEDQMRRVAKVYVAAAINDMEESYDKYLSVLVQDVEGNDISGMFTMEPKVANVVIPILSDQPERMVAVRVPISGKPALGYQLSLISTTPSMVRVFGDLNRLMSLDYADTEPVDVSDLKTDTSLVVRLAPLNGFTVYPREITVALKIEPVNSVTVSKSIILCHNVSEGHIAEVEQLTLSIIVYGPETFIAALNEADIVPYVDCAGLISGDYKLPINVSLPANIMVLSISEDRAAVTIIAPEAEPLDEEIKLAEDGREAIIE